MSVRNTDVAGNIHRNKLAERARCVVQYSFDVALLILQVGFTPETVFVVIGGQGQWLPYFHRGFHLMRRKLWPS